MKTPLRFLNAKYEDIPTEIQTCCDKMRETRKGLYVHGSVGTGKTHILWALKNKFDERCKENALRNINGPYSRVYNTTELLHEIRSQFDRKNENDTLSELLEYKDILLLDDIGAEKISDWVMETFYMLINRRYENMIPTIFTSNFSTDELAERIGDRTASRIVEMCDIFNLSGQDRRLKKVNNPVKT